MNTINGKLLKQMFAGGNEIVGNNYEYINELNVFPVPDGDTGSNMKITIQGAMDSVAANDGSDLFLLGKQFSRGLLMNARGNSGVIFSQIIKGFTSSIKEGQNELSVGDLILCFQNAKTAAYHSVTTPVEGTILTVIRVIAEKLEEKKSELNSVENFFQMVCSEGEIILAKTTEILPELKEIGVVDSGGYGLCRFLEGMNNVLHDGGKSLKTPVEPKVNKPINKNFVVKDDNNNGFGYCCEFIMTIGSKVELSQSDKEDFNLSKLKSALSKIGNSMVVVVDNDIVKVHIHTTEPYKILQIGSRYGEFNKIKIDNMTNEFLERNPGTTLGDINRQDSMKISDFKNDVKVIATVPSAKFAKIYSEEFKINETINTENTGNPSIQEFLKAITKCKSRKIILVVDDSNALLAANEATTLIHKDISVEIIPAKNIATSYLCCLTFNPMIPYKENVSKMIRTCRSADVGKISVSSKNVKYSHIDIQKNDIIGIVEKRILFAEKTTIETAKKLIDYLLKESKFLKKRGKKDVYLFYGADAQVRDVRDVEKYLNEAYSIKCITINGNQSTYSFYIGVR